MGNMCKKLYEDFTIKEKEILSEVLKKNSNKHIDICYHAKKTYGGKRHRTQRYYRSTKVI